MSSSNNSSKKSDDVLTQDIINDAIKVIQEGERYKPDTLYMPRNHLKQMLKKWEELEKKEKHLKKVMKTPLWKILNECSNKK